MKVTVKYIQCGRDTHLQEAADQVVILIITNAVNLGLVLQLAFYFNSVGKSVGELVLGSQETMRLPDTVRTFSPPPSPRLFFFLLGGGNEKKELEIEQMRRGFASSFCSPDCCCFFHFSSEVSDTGPLSPECFKRLSGGPALSEI